MKELSAKLKSDILYFFASSPNRSEIEAKINDVPALMVALTRFVLRGKGVEKVEATKLVERISLEISPVKSPKKNPAYKGKFPHKIKSVAGGTKAGGLAVTLNDGSRHVVTFADTGGIMPKVGMLFGEWSKYYKKPATKKNPITPGIVSRPVKDKARPIFTVEYSSKDSGPWTAAGHFPNRGLATDYAKSMHEVNPSKYWRVATK